MLALAARIGENYMHGIRVAGWAVSVGRADRQPSVLNDMDRFCDQALAEKTEDAGRAWFILAQIALNRDIDGARDYFEKALAATSEPKVVAWSHIYLARILDLEDDEEGGPLRAQALAHYQAAAGASESLPEAKKAAEQGLEKPYQPPSLGKRTAWL